MLEEVNFFVILGTLAGIYTYYWGIKKTQINFRINGEDLFLIFIGALLCGILGAKIPVWILNWDKIIAAQGIERIWLIITGRTLVGALIGGFIGVELTKKIIGVKSSTGNLFAPALAIGLALGRIGCFIKQCCYGVETNLPWAVYMHEAYRHPTQIYEAIFHFTAFIIMFIKIKKNSGKLKPGTLFPAYIFAYSIFRFITEFLRADAIITRFWGLSSAQLICLIVAGIIGGNWLVKYINLKRVK